MLQNIRDNSQGVIAKIIIGLIVAVFALFGVESIIGGFVRSPEVAEVNGEEITEVQLQNASQNLMASFGNVQGIDQGLVEQIALNRLIDETLLQQRAESGNLTVSSERIDRAIVSSPQFQIGGRFDSDLAVRTMATQGFSPATYRESLTQQILLGQLANAVNASNFVTDAELQRIAELTRQTRDFRYISIPMGARTVDSPITDAEIESYYQANQEEFREDETVVVSYVVLDQDQIAEELEVAEEELRAQYEGELDAYEGASERRAAHILFEVGPGMSSEEALSAAESALARLQDGEDFAALALELSSDTVSAEAGGDIGYSDGTAFPEPLEEALDTLQVDEVSGPVTTEFGVHIVKLTEAASMDFPSFDEARDRIEREIKAAEVGLIYGERLETLSNLAFESAGLENISTELGLEVQHSQAFPRSGGTGLFTNQQLVNAAFSDSVFLEGNNSDAIELSDAQAVVLRLEQFNEAAVPPLEEIRPQIAVLLRAEKEREAVQELGSELMEVVVQTGGDVDALMEAEGLQWVELEAVNRTSNAANRQVIEQAFTMPAPENEPGRASITLPNGTFVLLELTGVTPGSLESLSEQERQSLRSQISQSMGSSDLQSYITSLRNNADIQRREVLSEEF